MNTTMFNHQHPPQPPLPGIIPLSVRKAVPELQTDWAGELGVGEFPIQYIFSLRLPLFFFSF